MRFFDTHAHLNDEAFANISEYLERARNAGVQRIAVVGIDLETSRESVRLANEHPDQLVATVGIQPNHVSETKIGDWEEIVALTKSERVVAIGESGLDCYWDRAPLELQREFFRKHLALAKEIGASIVIHMRDSGPPILEELHTFANGSSIRGVMHSFTGDKALARQCLELGLFISFAGMVTYKKSEELRDVARFVPLDRLLIETDSPYLSPEPHRGKRPNESAMVIHTAKCLAEVHGVTIETLAETTFESAETLYRRSLL